YLLELNLLNILSINSAVTKLARATITIILKLRFGSINPRCATDNIQPKIPKVINKRDKQILSTFFSKLSIPNPIKISIGITMPVHQYWYPIPEITGMYLMV